MKKFYPLITLFVFALQLLVPTQLKAQCNTPIGLSATNMSQTGAYLYLTPTSTNVGTFNIRYHSANSTVLTTIEHVSLPYQLGSLVCGTTYEWQVQQVCVATAPNITTVSDWSTGGTFTTLACPTPTLCNAPVGLSATNVSQTGASLYLSPTSSNTGTFNIRYHGANVTTWTTLEHVTLPYQLVNLACGTTYEWQAQLICQTASGTFPTVSAWSAGGSFTTLACPPNVTCATPTTLTTTDIHQTSAILHWGAVSGAVAYIVRYKNSTSASVPFLTLTSSTNSITLTGLVAGNYYIWQVQAVCSIAGTTVGASSALSAIATFATPSFLIYPNPTSKYVNVSLSLEKQSNTSILLRDSYGQVVYSSLNLAQEGTNNFEIDTSSLSAGLYFLSIQTDSYSSTSKIIIAR